MSVGEQIITMAMCTPNSLHHCCTRVLKVHLALLDLPALLEPQWSSDPMDQWLSDLLDLQEKTEYLVYQ